MLLYPPLRGGRGRNGGRDEKTKAPLSQININSKLIRQEKCMSVETKFICQSISVYLMSNYLKWSTRDSIKINSLFQRIERPLNVCMRTINAFDLV